jgi:hypothetical protein
VLSSLPREPDLRPAVPSGSARLHVPRPARPVKQPVRGRRHRRVPAVRQRPRRHRRRRYSPRLRPRLRLGQVMPQAPTPPLAPCRAGSSKRAPPCAGQQASSTRSTSTGTPSLAGSGAASTWTASALPGSPLTPGQCVL